MQPLPTRKNHPSTRRHFISCHPAAASPINPARPPPPRKTPPPPPRHFISCHPAAASLNLPTSQTTAKHVYDAEQADVSNARPAVDALIADIWETIEFNLRKLDG